MTIRRNGFSMLEMLLVLVIGGVILAVGTRQYSQISNSRAVGNAANAMVSIANRARSEAMRGGKVVYLRAYMGNDRVEVETATDSLLHEQDMGDDGVEMTGSDISICYAARGYALPGCTGVTSTVTLHFVRGVDTASVQVLPLGQIRRTR